MSSYYTDQKRIYQAAVDFDTADAELTFSPVVPINVLKLHIVLTEASSAASSVVTVGVRDSDDAAGSDVVTSYGTFDVAAGLAANSAFIVNVAGVDADAVVNSGEHSQVSEVTTGRVDGYQTNLPGEIKVNPGQTFVVQSNGAGTGGAAIVGVEYIEQGDDPARKTKTTITFTRA